MSTIITAAVAGDLAQACSTAMHTHIFSSRLIVHMKNCQTRQLARHTTARCSSPRYAPGSGSWLLQIYPLRTQASLQYGEHV